MEERKKPKVVVFSYFVNPKYNFIENIVDWHQSMKINYLSECDRQFVIYTDNDIAKSKITDPNVKIFHVDPSTTENKHENILRKFMYIQDFTDKGADFDYFCFIQSNARCVKPVSLKELVGEKECNLVVFRHCAFPQNSFSALYHNKVGSSADISKTNTAKFTYMQACHFIADKNILSELCGFINGSIEHDRKHPEYENWHYNTLSTYDESYFNYYVSTKLIPELGSKVRILDGHVYIHAPYSSRRDFKIEMLDKSKPYVAAAFSTMSMSVEEMLRHSLVISISDERLDLFKQIFKAHGLEPFPEKFTGVTDQSKTPVQNCKESHIQAIALAKERNWPYVCVFEDDAYPMTGIREKLEYYLAEIPQQCKMLVLGNSYVRKCSVFSNRLCQNFEGWGSHAYIVFQDYYDKHMEYLRTAPVADYWHDTTLKGLDFSKLFAPRKNLFIQFTKRKEGIHDYGGYILLNVMGKCLNQNEALRQGFPRIESIVPSVSYSVKPNKNIQFMFG